MRQHVLLCSAPVPALAVGIAVMRHAHVAAGAWLTNLVAGTVGLLLLATGRRIPVPSTPRMRLALAAAGIVALLFCFLAPGSDGVHRWLFLGGLRVHAASIAAPLLIAAVAAAAAREEWITAVAVAAVTTIVLALQPDAAQAVSFAAACSAILIFRFSAGAALLVVLAASSFVRPDPLPPVPYVEGILTLARSIGPVWAALGALALVLLPLPFFARFCRYGDRLSLALGVYIASITLAPFWGTFPVPVMGFGVSPIAGYFIALALPRNPLK